MFCLYTDFAFIVHIKYLQIVCLHKYLAVAVFFTCFSFTTGRILQLKKRINVQLGVCFSLVLATVSYFTGFRIKYTLMRSITSNVDKFRYESSIFDTRKVQPTVCYCIYDV